MLQFFIDNYNGDIKQIINQKSGGGTPWVRDAARRPLDSRLDEHVQPVLDGIHRLSGHRAE